jgi:hypothetical protein
MKITSLGLYMVSPRGREVKEDFSTFIFCLTSDTMMTSDNGTSIGSLPTTGNLAYLEIEETESSLLVLKDEVEVDI